MGDIAKLDYSKPPSDRSAPWWDVRHEHERANLWATYKRHNDPPGMSVVWEPDDKHFAPHVDGEWHVCVGDAVQVAIGNSVCWWKRCSVSDKERMAVEARAAAWSWYDTRLSLANTHSAVWPECLGYTDDICAELLEGPASKERTRQSEEHAASSLALLDYSSAPPGWVQDPNSEWAYEADTGPGSKCRSRTIDVAWSHYKAEHNPPGMWCGFCRGAHEMETCSLRAGVSACGARWELMLNLRVPFKGYLSRCRTWAWAWHDRRHALARRMMQDVDVVDVVQFHLILCWHDEWVAAVDAWLVEKSAPPPEALATLRRTKVRR